MKRRDFIVNCTVLAASGISVGCQHPDAAVVGVEADNSLTAILSDYREKNDIPGVAMAIVKQGKIIYSDALGMANIADALPMTTSTRCHYYSLTKIMTATAIMQLASRSKIDLKKDVHFYLPELKIMDKSNHKPKLLSLEHLLRHQSGFGRELASLAIRFPEQPDNSMSLLSELIANNRLSFEPGSESQYSNINYALLAAVVESVTGLSFDAYMREFLFVPLGMKDCGRRGTSSENIVTGYLKNWSFMDIMVRWSYSENIKNRLFIHRPGLLGDSTLGAFELSGNGFGEFVGSIDDLAMFMQFQLAKGNAQADQVLPEQWREKMRHVARRGYGYGWLNNRYKQYDTYSTTGGGPGFGSYMALIPELDFGVAVISNRFVSDTPAMADLFDAIN